MRNCVVLLDTSASMNQRTANNLSLLDIGKAGIEQMVRRFPNGLKFLLVTTRSGGTVESGWHDSQDDFLAKVKNLVARDLSDLPVACISSLPDCQFHQLQLTLMHISGRGRCGVHSTRLSNVGVWLTWKAMGLGGSRG